MKIEPERIAFLGDVHMNTQFMVAAVAEAARQGADVIVQCGDFGYTFKKSFLSAVDAACEKHKMPLMFVDGNHENFDWLNAQPLEEGFRPLTDWISHLPRAYRWEWGGVTFLALGGGVSVDQHVRMPGISWWEQETLTSTERVNAMSPGGVDVMITHDCPAGVDLDLPANPFFPEKLIRASDQHRQMLRNVVDEVKPKFLWHGHYHLSHTSVYGGAVRVRGLNMDETPWEECMEVVDLADLKKSRLKLTEVSGA